MRSCMSITFSEFMKVYERLDIKNLVDRGESYYNKLMPGVVEKLKEAGTHS